MAADPTKPLRGGHRYVSFVEGVRHHVRAASAGDGPILNVNLVQLNQHDGVTRGDTDPSERALRAYWDQLHAIIRSASGGRLVYSGRVEKRYAAGRLAVAHPWDGILIVEYPSLAEYVKVVEDAAFHSIKHLRVQALAASVLYTATASGVAHDEAVRRLRQLDAAGTSVSCVVATAAPSEVDAGSGVVLEGRAFLRGEAGHQPWRFFSLQPAPHRRGDDAAVHLQLRSAAASHAKL